MYAEGSFAAMTLWFDARERERLGDVRVSISGRGVVPEDVRLRRLDPLPGGTAAG
jgi:hypothetical protein